jgi:hypothetical protein
MNGSPAGHRVALTERGLAEALTVTCPGTRSITVRLPIVWRLLGKQTLLIAERT